MTAGAARISTSRAHGRARAMPTPARSGNDNGGGEDSARGAGTDADGERSLAGGSVGLEVADVVHQEHRDGVQADPHRAEHAPPRDAGRLRGHRPERRDEAEEDEDAHFAPATVAVGARRAGIGPRGGDGRGADGEQPPLVRQHRHGETQERADGERGERRRLHARRPRLPRGDEALRPDAVGIGPADAVRVVVRVVDRYLERESDAEGERRDSRTERAEGRRRRRADGDGSDRRGEGLGACAANPVTRRRGHAGLPSSPGQGPWRPSGRSCQSRGRAKTQR